MTHIKTGRRKRGGPFSFSHNKQIRGIFYADSERFFCKANFKAAGILCVFQGFEMMHCGKRSAVG